MKKDKLNQGGFSLIIILIVVLVVGVLVFAGLKVAKSNDSTVNQAVSTPVTEPIAQISTQDQAILTQAKKLKKVDFDLDGVVNSLDNDDDNDGINDDEDSDSDNDGVDNDSDNEASQQSELQNSQND